MGGATGDAPAAEEAIRLLLEQGGAEKKDINYRDSKSGKTPLHIAAEYKQVSL